MKKKLIALGLSVLMAGSFTFGLCGCGDSGDADTAGGGTEGIEVLLDYDEDYMPSETKAVMYLSGSWHDIGYQYATENPDAVKIAMSSELEKAIGRNGSFEDALAAAQPCLDIIDEQAPFVRELWEGIGEGLGVGFDVVAVSQANYAAPPEENCSTIAAWGSATKDGKLYVGSNQDAEFYGGTYLPALVVHPDDGNAFITSSGFKPGLVMNDKGLVVSGSGGQSGDPEDMQCGLPAMMIRVLIANQCDNVKQGKKVALNTKTECTNLHLSDVGGNDVVIEKTPRETCTRVAGDYGEKDFTIATNTYLDEKMWPSLYTGEDIWDDALPRYWTEEKIITDNLGKVTPEVLNQALGCTESYVDTGYDDVLATGEQIGWYKLKEGEWIDEWDLSDYTGFWSPENKEPGTKCLARTIADPENQKVYIMNGGRNDLVSPIPYSTGNFVTLTLGEDEGMTNYEAKQDAQRQIFRAERDINKAREADVDTTETMKDLNKAKKALLKADNMASKAGCLEDTNRSLYYLSKATSLYCKAQAYGQLAQDDKTSIKRKGDNYVVW